MQPVQHLNHDECTVHGQVSLKTLERCRITNPGESLPLDTLAALRPITPECAVRSLKTTNRSSFFLKTAICYVGILMVFENRRTNLRGPIAVAVSDDFKQVEVLDREMVGTIGE